MVLWLGMETPSPAARRERRHAVPVLELAIVGTDIREDSCRYSVFIVEVGHGRASPRELQDARMMSASPPELRPPARPLR